jgi:hypothetical protein
MLINELNLWSISIFLFVICLKINQIYIKQCLKKKGLVNNFYVGKIPLKTGGQEIIVNMNHITK